MPRVNSSLVAARLRQIIRIRVNSLDGLTDYGATLAAREAATQMLIDILDPPAHRINPDERYDAAESGPEQSREEVVGTSTRGKSSNLGNSGYSGGSTMRVTPAKL